MAEDWEQYYSGFSPVAGAPVNTGTALQNTYYAPAATYSAPQGNYQPQPAPQQQALLPYQGSYSELRGWNPDPMAANNSGPALQGGDWGGLVSDAYQYPDQAQQQAPAPSPYGDLSGSNFSTNPGGDYNDQFNAPYTNPYGDLSASNAKAQTMRNAGFVEVDGDWVPGHLAAGGATLGGYQPQPTYTDPAGGAQLQHQNPYGDLSGATPAPYGNLSGVPAMQPPSPYGNLSGNPIDPMAGFGASYPPPAQSAYNDWLNKLGATDSGRYQEIYRNTVDSSFQNPAQSYQNPTTPQTFGALQPSFDAMSDRDMQGFDQTYMDQPQGSYGALLGAGGDMPPSYETPGGSPLAPPTQPVNTGYQAPTQTYQNPTTPQTYGDLSGSQNVATGGAQLPYQDWLKKLNVTDSGRYQEIYRNTVGPMVMPSSQDSASSAGPMPASQQFASGMGSTFGTQMPSPDFGNLNLNFQPMPSTPDTKIADRAPQLGGFVSYSAPQLPQPATPTQPQGLQAITNALGGEPARQRQTGDGWMNLFGN